MTGSEFKQLRLSRGFKCRRELAEHFQCSVSAVKKWENGQRRVNRIVASALERMDKK